MVNNTIKNIAFSCLISRTGFRIEQGISLDGSGILISPMNNVIEPSISEGITLYTVDRVSNVISCMKWNVVDRAVRRWNRKRRRR